MSHPKLAILLQSYVPHPSMPLSRHQLHQRLWHSHLMHLPLPCLELKFKCLCWLLQYRIKVLPPHLGLMYPKRLRPPPKLMMMILLESIVFFPSYSVDSVHESFRCPPFPISPIFLHFKCPREAGSSTHTYWTPRNTSAFAQSAADKRCAFFATRAVMQELLSSANKKKSMSKHGHFIMAYTVDEDGLSWHRQNATALFLHNTNTWIDLFIFKINLWHKSAGSVAVAATVVYHDAIHFTVR